MDIYLRLIVFLSLIALVSCSNPKNTPLPHDLDKMDSVTESMQKLNPEDRDLAAGYIMRHTVGAKLAGMFGGQEGAGIPDGMTIGKAIEEQRKFKADEDIEQAKQQALKTKLHAEHEAAMNAMRNAITVTLISKHINVERGYSGITMNENLEVTFGYKNNTNKDIAGVKGRISVNDLFGDEISGFIISNDETIKAQQTVNWTGSRSVMFSLGNNHDRKLAELGDDKFKVVWYPQIIIFKDGTTLEIPE